MKTSPPITTLLSGTLNSPPPSLNHADHSLGWRLHEGQTVTPMSFCALVSASHKCSECECVLQCKTHHFLKIVTVVGQKLMGNRNTICRLRTPSRLCLPHYCLTSKTLHLKDLTVCYPWDIFFKRLYSLSVFSLPLHVKLLRSWNPLRYFS